MIDTEVEIQSIGDRLRGYVEDVEKLSRQVGVVPERKLKQVENSLSRLNAKHTLYCQAQQLYIAMDDSLMNLVAQYQEMGQMVSDSIQRQQQRFQWLEDFNQAERFIFSQDSAYQRLLKQSMLLSQIEKTAPALEKLKGQEQLLFADVDAYFQKAKVAAESTPALKKRQAQLEEKYIELKNSSEKIQAAEYMPLLDRIKDKLMGIAAVGIILMFFNMVVSKIQGYKKMRENAKQMEEMLRKSKDDYPKI
ncbi:hypothetical protein [Phocaeicola barnesiae]|jgi:hypothetical protein|nr:hypothetical protein [Phocaeicola barnesiae]MBS6469531.1 hypothetical protein [Bacteroides sp.]MCF2597501.1 hypothetical protein [Phocaeicola barnesiae]